MWLLPLDHVQVCAALSSLLQLKATSAHSLPPLNVLIVRNKYQMHDLHYIYLHLYCDLHCMLNIVQYCESS